MYNPNRGGTVNGDWPGRKTFYPDNRVGMKRFKLTKKNEIPFGQDFGQHKGLPTDVVFEVCDDPFPTEGRIWIRAPGYGMKPYGNGRITVYPKDLWVPGLEIIK